MSPVPRHEIPGRIVLAVGWAVSICGVALLIILWLGSRDVAGPFS